MIIQTVKTIPHISYMQENPMRDQSRENSRALAKMMNLYHKPQSLLKNQCNSTLVQKINAPLPLVWSILRQFNNPQAYKRFIRSCSVRAGDGGPGSVRDVLMVSGLPAERSTERLDKLDDELHVIVVSIIDGDHRLVNYQSTTTLHEDDVGNCDKTVVVESYVVDIPEDSCGEDTCLFVDTIIGCNLRSLAQTTEKMVCKARA